MFQSNIMTTPFSTPIADKALSNIYSESAFLGDYSLVSTMRALLCDKTKDTVALHSISNAIEEVMNDLIDDANNTVIIAFGEVTQSNKDSFERNGYKKVDKVTDFYVKAFPVQCYINEERKSSIVMIESTASKWKWHFIQCSIPAFMPWYFNTKEGLPKEKMDLIRSLMQKDSSQYKKAIEVIYDKTDIKKAFIESTIKDFTDGISNSLISDKKDRINTLRARVERYQEEIRNMVRELDEENRLLCGLKMSESDEEAREFLTSYIEKNDRIVVKRSEGGHIVFVVKDYIQYYDQDFMEDCLNNSRSYFYAYDSRISNEDMKLLMTGLFIDNVIKLRVCGVFNLGADGSVSAMTGYNYEDIADIYMPNPHLDRYGCMGDYPNIIYNLITKDADYVGAIEQCVASCRDLNFTDSTVMENFVERITNTNNKVIELPDGTLVSPKEAITWLKTQEDK